MNNVKILYNINNMILQMVRTYLEQGATPHQAYTAGITGPLGLEMRCMLHNEMTGEEIDAYDAVMDAGCVLHAESHDLS